MAWSIVDAACDFGAARRGAAGAPRALHAAGLTRRLGRLGNAHGFAATPAPGPAGVLPPAGTPSGDAAHMAAWIAGIRTTTSRARAASPRARILTVGGDHSVSAGSLTAAAHAAAAAGAALHVLWIDAHPDLHTPATTTSGNLHGTPLGYALGLPGFAGMPAFRGPVDPRDVRLFATRSIDPAERSAIDARGIIVQGMDAIAAHGARRLVEAFLERVRASGGHLHVSFDVDSLDPSLAPATGTPVAGGLRCEDAYPVMIALRDSGLVTSADVVEYDPSLDAGGRTAALVVDLVATLCGEGGEAKTGNRSRRAGTETVR